MAGHAVLRHDHQVPERSRSWSDAKAGWPTTPMSVSTSAGSSYPSSPSCSTPASSTPRALFFPGSSTPAAPLAIPAPTAPDASSLLSTGDAAHVDGRTFRVGRELGRGNFGVVFEAFGSGLSTPVALKLSTVKDSANLSAQARSLEELKLLSEVDVLRRLTDDLLRLRPEAASHVSAYICHTLSPCKVLLVMTKAVGLSLDEWLYGMDSDDVKHIPPKDWLEGRLPRGPASHTDSVGLVSACAFASTLLSQVAPVFSVLQSIGFHRDVSAHNFLVDDSAMCRGGSPHFTLIDLGLSVEASSWSWNWRDEDVAGDPRYWSPAHCIKVILHGSDMEKQFAYLVHVYRERIDHYALGVLVLELVFGRWVGPKDEARASGALKAVVEARASWRRYWFLAWTLFETLHAIVDDGADDWERHRRIAGTGLHVAFFDALQELCAALRSAAGHMAHAPCGGTEVASLLSTVVALIDPASTLAWDRVPIDR